MSSGRCLRVRGLLTRVFTHKYTNVCTSVKIECCLVSWLPLVIASVLRGVSNQGMSSGRCWGNSPNVKCARRAVCGGSTADRSTRARRPPTIALSAARGLTSQRSLLARRGFAEPSLTVAGYD